MRVAFRSNFLFVLALLSLIFAPVIVNADVTIDEASKMLPYSIGDFRAHGRIRPQFETATPEDFGVLSAAERSYFSVRGGGFAVTIIKTRSDSGAYALLTSTVSEDRKSRPSLDVKTGDIGTASFISPDSVLFFKGATFVSVRITKNDWGSADGMITLARLFAETLDKGEGEIPVLVKHLPDWESAQERLTYAVSRRALQEFAGARPALDAVNFDGGTEAVSATYDTAQVVLIEYTTPQIATISDASITERIRQLRDRGEPAPTAYRRVGNYSVFVFDAPNERMAAHFIDQISYEQVVQWLGDDPRALERAQRIYSQTTAGVILAVLKASGLSLLICLGIGGIFGTVIFRRRRAQQAAAQAYSDAGGLMRLNLDEMTPQSDAAKWLGRGDG